MHENAAACTRLDSGHFSQGRGGGGSDDSDPEFSAGDESESETSETESESDESDSSGEDEGPSARFRPAKVRNGDGWEARALAEAEQMIAESERNNKRATDVGESILHEVSASDMNGFVPCNVDPSIAIHQFALLTTQNIKCLE